MERLSKYTTLQLGGPCGRLISVLDEGALIEALHEAHQARQPVFILGGGSNVVVADEGFDGWVIRYIQNKVQWIDEGTHIRVVAEGGAVWDSVVQDACARGLGQLAFLSGIPGSVGAAPVQNIGAYGVELADVLDRVHAIDRTTGARVVLAHADCGFGYRQSFFKSTWLNRYVITRVEMLLEPHAPLNISHDEIARALGEDSHDAMAVREAVLQTRKRKSMVLDPHDLNSRSVGSFFMNPIVSVEKAQEVFERMQAMHQSCPRFPQADGRVKLSAARLLEAAGIQRGLMMGGAKVSDKHVLAITNPGNATTRDVLALAAHMQNAVKSAFGVILEMEPVRI